MLIAYYSRGCDSRDLFAGRKIEHDREFGEHLNQYDVIYLNMQQFLIEAESEKVTEYLEQEVLCERFHMDFAEAGNWYDGYMFTNFGHIYNPKSVVEAMQRHKFSNGYTGEILLVAVNYDKNNPNKPHDCVIERMVK